MSPYFIRQFKYKNPCPSCPIKNVKERAASKSLCPQHLAIARLAWRCWAVERRLEGLCINCSRKAVKMNCRCRTHREENRLKCQAWDREHGKKHRAAQYQKTKDLIDSGRCRCRAHNVLKPGQRRCDECRLYQKAYYQRDLALLAKLREERRERQLAKDAEVIKEAKAQLAAMGYAHSVGTSVRQLNREITNVRWDGKKWMARIGVNYKQIYLGRFGSKEEAVEAYRAAAVKYHGKSYLNPPLS